MFAVLSAGAAPALLAHQGGWDEVLMIGGPILIIVALLRVAKRRVDNAASTASTPPSSRSDPD